jgi:transposase
MKWPRICILKFADPVAWETEVRAAFRPDLNYNQIRAILGVSRTTITDWAKELGLSRGAGALGGRRRKTSVEQLEEQQPLIDIERFVEY